MKAKLIGIFVSILLIVTTFSVMGMTEEKQVHQVNNRNSGNGDELDQYQNISDDPHCAFDGPEWYAQSFVPNKTITSKVAIFVGRINEPNYLHVGIKYDLNGKIIASTTKHYSSIPTTPNWVEFDIPDVYTPLDKTCYIVITEEGSSHGGHTYKIFGSRTDVYDFGFPYYSHDEGKSWEKKSGDLAFKTYVSGMDTPPNPPSISGPTSGKPGVKLPYRFNAVDPDGDFVKYVIDWDDGNVETTDFYPSGTDVMVYHKWYQRGTFTINVTAIDIYKAESDWTILEVTMPRDRATHNSLFYRLLEQFPLLEKIVCYIL